MPVLNMFLNIVGLVIFYFLAIYIGFGDFEYQIEIMIVNIVLSVIAAWRYNIYKVKQFKKEYNYPFEDKRQPKFYYYIFSLILISFTIHIINSLDHTESSYEKTLKITSYLQVKTVKYHRIENSEDGYYFVMPDKYEDDNLKGKYVVATFKQGLLGLYHIRSVKLVDEK